jgi:hypothetical protein
MFVHPYLSNEIFLLVTLNKSSNIDFANDSEMEFLNKFRQTVSKECCKEILGCSLGEPFESMQIDTFLEIRRINPDIDFLTD